MSEQHLAQKRLTRVVTVEDEELVLDGGRIVLKFFRHSGRKVGAQMLLDADVKVVQRPATSDET